MPISAKQKSQIPSIFTQNYLKTTEAMMKKKFIRKSMTKAFRKHNFHFTTKNPQRIFFKKTVP
jgi:hypothetical protein